jgi:N12 class adenine-specific DNA methylase
VVARNQAGELRQLLGLRDAVMALLDAEASSPDDTADLDGLRAGLGRRYDAYVRVFGPLNRFSWRRTGRVDPGTGQERMARVRPRQVSPQIRTAQPYMPWSISTPSASTRPAGHLRFGSNVTALTAVIPVT